MMLRLLSFLVFAPMHLAIWLLGGCFRALRWLFTQRSWLADELRRATVWSSETTHDGRFRDFHLYAKPDRVYQLVDGRLCVTEFKTREQFRAYRSDIVQISVGAAALAARGFAVAPYGYVIVENAEDGTRQCIRVDLLHDDALELALNRYKGVMGGSLSPRRAYNRKCAQCGHRDTCTPAGAC